MEQETKINMQEIITRLTKLQEDINFLREHIDDITLTEEDIIALKEAEKDYREGRTISLEDLRNELITSQIQRH